MLYSGSFDRTVKIWSLDDRSYVDTLYGHQSEVRCSPTPMSAVCKPLHVCRVDLFTTYTDSQLSCYCSNAALQFSAMQCKLYRGPGAGSGCPASGAGADQRAGPYMPCVEGAGGVPADFQVL